MKAEELRIGNWVVNVDEYWEVRLVDFNSMYIEKSCPFKPIPLTEEWLIKFGFDSTPHHENVVYYYNVNFDFRIEAYSNGYISFEEWADLKYVHQLQNLYFALTGEELQSKD